MIEDSEVIRVSWSVWLLVLSCFIILVVMYSKSQTHKRAIVRRDVTQIMKSSITVLEVNEFTAVVTHYQGAILTQWDIDVLNRRAGKLARGLRVVRLNDREVGIVFRENIL